MSSSTVDIVDNWKVSIKKFATFSDRNAGKVGPSLMFFTPKCKRARRTMTAFCSYQAML